MTKSEIVTTIARNARIERDAARKALESLILNIRSTLKKGNKVTIVGFGTFSVSERRERMGRNPRTGERVRLPVTRTATFSAAKELRDGIN